MPKCPAIETKLGQAHRVTLELHGAIAPKHWQDVITQG
jgi:hypothetical protein